MHKLFYFRIDNEEAGLYRKRKVFISGSKYPLPKPEDVKKLMKEFVKNLEILKEKKHPVEMAAISHMQFVFIHPFIDGNGRVARLLMNLILLQNGYNIAIIPSVLRKEYIENLEKAHTDNKDFIFFIAKMVRESLKDYIRLFIR